MEANTKKLMTSSDLELLFVTKTRWGFPDNFKSFFKTEIKFRKIKITQGKSDSVNLITLKKQPKSYRALILHQYQLKGTEKASINRVHGNIKDLTQKLKEYQISVIKSYKRNIVAEIRQLKFI